MFLLPNRFPFSMAPTWNPWWSSKVNRQVTSYFMKKRVKKQSQINCVWKLNTEPFCVFIALLHATDPYSLNQRKSKNNFPFKKCWIVYRLAVPLVNLNYSGKVQRQFVQMTLGTERGLAKALTHADWLSWINTIRRALGSWSLDNHSASTSPSP